MKCNTCLHGSKHYSRMCMKGVEVGSEKCDWLYQPIKTKKFKLSEEQKEWLDKYCQQVYDWAIDECNPNPRRSKLYDFIEGIVNDREEKK